jgi:hypothetical protein
MSLYMNIFGSVRRTLPVDIERLLNEYGADPQLGLDFSGCPGRIFAEENHSIAMRLIAEDA